MHSLMSRCFLLLTLGFVPAAASTSELWVIGHPESPVEELSREELRNIYMGRQSYFPNTLVRAVPIDLPLQSALARGFYAEVVRITELKLNRYRARLIFSGKGVIPEKVNDSVSAVELVSNNLGAIAYVTADTDIGANRILFKLNLD